MVYKFFDKNFSGGTVKNEIVFNKKLAEELHKPVTRKFQKWKIHSTFIDNIWAAHQVDMQLIINQGFRFLLCVSDMHSKYAWVIPLKD